MPIMETKPAAQSDQVCDLVPTVPVGVLVELDEEVCGRPLHPDSAQ